MRILAIISGEYGIRHVNNLCEGERACSTIHFPCLASMVKLNDYNHDTLMHESGHLLQENLAGQLKPFKQTRYIAPGGLVNDPPSS
jgi:hypothetical protein